MKSKPAIASRKTATKLCPECNVQIPCACKTCTCGHVFKSRTSQGGGEPSQQQSPEQDRLRRTERTKRAPPDFYHIHVESARLRRAYAASLSSRAAEGSTTRSSNRPHLRKSPQGLPTGRPRAPGLAVIKRQPISPPDTANESSNSSTTDSSKADTEKDMNQYESLPPEKQKQYAILLSEINRKFGRQNFRPS